MDAVKYLKEVNRMCDCSGCYECPLYGKNNGKKVNCKMIERRYAEEAVSIVEKWSAEHPVKTRQSEFLKMFPDARVNSDGVIDIDPCDLNERLERECDRKYDNCDDCYKDYWLFEVE